MMKLIKTLIIICVFTSCGPDDAIPETPINDQFDPTTAMLLKAGMLVGVNHTASGTASVFHSNGRHTVVLDPFESQNGPDLKVYLSKSVDATEYVNLGQLKSITGKQSYDVPAGVNPANYPFVLIWCEKFSVIFAKAELKEGS